MVPLAVSNESQLAFPLLACQSRAAVPMLPTASGWESCWPGRSWPKLSVVGLTSSIACFLAAGFNTCSVTPIWLFPTFEVI